MPLFIFFADYFDYAAIILFRFTLIIAFIIHYFVSFLPLITPFSFSFRRLLLSLHFAFLSSPLKMPLPPLSRHISAAISQLPPASASAASAPLFFIFSPYFFAFLLSIISLFLLSLILCHFDFQLFIIFFFHSPLLRLLLPLPHIADFHISFATLLLPFSPLRHAVSYYYFRLFSSAAISLFISFSILIRFSFSFRFLHFHIFAFAIIFTLHFHLILLLFRYYCFITPFQAFIFSYFTTLLFSCHYWYYWYFFITLLFFISSVISFAFISFFHFQIAIFSFSCLRHFLHFTIIFFDYSLSLIFRY